MNNVQSPMMLESLFISMPMMVCAVFTAELMLSWLRQRDSAQGWLAVWALAATLLYGGHFVFFHHAMRLLPLSDTVYVACNLLVYPLYLIYISEMTERRPLSTRLGLLVVLIGPSVVFAMAAWMAYAAMTTAETVQFLDGYLYHAARDGLEGPAAAQVWIHDVARVVFALQVVAVMVTGIRKIRRYNQRLKYVFADTEDKHLGGITVVLWLLVVTSLFSVVANAVGRQFFDNSLLLALPSLLFSILLFAICWMGLQARSYVYEMEEQPEQAPQPAKSETSETGGSSPDYPGLVTQFEQLMNSEQLYLLHDLRLDMAVQRLGTNRTYLLAALKQELGMTFNEYVNNKRIAYAHRLMEEHPDMLKSDVAARSGYNSQSAFYRNLKALSE